MKKCKKIVVFVMVFLLLILQVTPVFAEGEPITSTPLEETYTINKIEDIKVVKESGNFTANLPKAIITNSSGTIVRKSVEYSSSALGSNASFYSSDRFVTFSKDTPAGTYPVTVSLADDSTVTTIFNIIIEEPEQEYSILLSQDDIVLIKKEPGVNFKVSLPEAVLVDAKGNPVDEEFGPIHSDFDDYVVGFEEDNLTLTLSKDIPEGTYTLVYGIYSNLLVSKDFKIIVRTASEDATLSDLTVDTVIVPNFDSATTTYDLANTTASSIVIDATKNDSNATVTGDIGAKNLSYGANAFTIIVTAEDGTTTKDYTINITRNYELKYTAGTGGSITGTAMQIVAPNGSGTEVTAVADTGYKFSKWSDGVTTAARTDTNVTSDVRVTAEFTVQTKVATPTANSNGGNFTGSTQLTLASTTAGASIYYTLDGSEPTTQSAMYVSPITINQTTTLKAMATITGAIDSDVLTVTFTKNSSSSRSSNSNNTVKGKADNTSFSVGKKKTIYNSDGEKETIVTVKESAIKKQVDKVDVGNKISIPVAGNTDIDKAKFTVQSIKDMQKKDLILEVKTDDATYELPTGVIDVKAISEEIGEEVALDEIPFTVEISKTGNEMIKVVENSAKESGLAIVVPSVDFKIETSYKGKSYKVDTFNAFVTRTIEIPSNVDVDKITTAIITEVDGSVRHIPTCVTKIDGKYYATINSLTNSTYTLIYNEVIFSDVTDSHWAKADIEKMASRLVVEGKEDGTFSPDESITRAELAQILVKALGLKPVEVDKFVDVESGTEYAGYIGTAYSYGINKGTSETTFNPEGLVTRQDAMTMIYRAGMIADSVDEDHTTDMTDYVDYKDVSDYAKDAVMWNVNNGIIVGKTDTTLVPLDNITRAELSAVTNRLLKTAGLIE